MQTVVETPTFSRQVEKSFSEEEERELIDLLAENPLAGDEIRGTAGVRNVRFAASGRGKRDGARVIHLLPRRDHAALCPAGLRQEPQDTHDPG